MYPYSLTMPEWNQYCRVHTSKINEIYLPCSGEKEHELERRVVYKGHRMAIAESTLATSFSNLQQYADKPREFIPSFYELLLESEQ